MDNFVNDAISRAAALGGPEALDALSKLLSEHPRDHRVWSARAMVRGRLGDLGGADADWSEAVEMKPGEPHYRYMRGIDRFHRCHYLEALSDFTAAIELCERHGHEYYLAPSYLFRAETFLRLGQIEQAKLDCTNVPKQTTTWTDRLRTKEDILADCERHAMGS